MIFLGIKLMLNDESNIMLVSYNSKIRMDKELG